MGLQMNPKNGMNSNHTDNSVVIDFNNFFISNLQHIRTFTARIAIISKMMLRITRFRSFGDSILEEGEKMVYLVRE